MNKIKSENLNSLLRVPKPKISKFGLHIPQVAMPHDELIGAKNLISEDNSVIQPQNTKSAELTGYSQSSRGSRSGLSSQGSESSLSSQTINTIKPHLKEDLVEKNSFQSEKFSPISFQEPAEKLFIGKDKDLYEKLYSLTLGSVDRKNRIRISKNKLMKLSGIGSRVTFDLCVERLLSKNLLKLTIFSGEHSGNEFEILLPQFSVKEIGRSTQTTDPTRAAKPILPTQTTVYDKISIDNTTPTTPTTQNMADDNSEVIIEEEEDIEIKNEYAAMIEILERVSKKFSKNESNSNPEKDWKELAQLLANKVESAAKTKIIDNVPAFLIADLRRRLSD